MKNRRYRFPLLGISLIIFGTALLLDRFGYLNFSWDRILAVCLLFYGLGSMWRVAIHGERARVFIATLTVLVGSLILLNSLNFFVQSPDFFLVVALGIVGISFVSIYVFDSREWVVLLVGVVFLIITMGVGASRLGIIEWHLFTEFIGRYWPAALILIGIGMLLRHRSGAVIDDSARERIHS